MREYSRKTANETVTVQFKKELKNGRSYCNYVSSRYKNRLEELLEIPHK
jgi:hypothetical protein